MRGFTRGLIAGVLIIIVIVVLVGGYLGLIPGFSRLFGSNQPRDLGVSLVAPGSTQLAAKAGVTVEQLPPALPPEQSIQVSQQTVNINNNFTEQEVTTVFNQNWEYAQVTDVEVRINQDNTFELSGVFHEERVEGCARALRFSEEDITILKRSVEFIRGNPPVYSKCRLEIANTQVTVLDISVLQIGRINLSPSQIDQIKAVVINFFQAHFISIRSLSFNNSQCHFEGTLPAVISFSPP